MARSAVTCASLVGVARAGIATIIAILLGCSDSGSRELVFGYGGGSGGATGGGQGGSNSSGGVQPEAGSPSGGAGASAGGSEGAGQAGALSAAGGASSPGGGSLGGAGAGGGVSIGGTGGSAGAGGGAAGQVILFDGQGLDAWRPKAGGDTAPWLATGDYFAVMPGSGDLVTRESFGDVELHVEFWVPQTPTTHGEQDRGNSGIYLQGRYEVQVLDSHQHLLEGANDCAAIYELANANVNAALPAETWQTYVITFRAPRWDGDQKTANARISVVWNGQVAHSEVEVPAPTRLGDPEAPGEAPLRLQDHSHAVRYRNVWLKRL